VPGAARRAFLPALSNSWCAQCEPIAVTVPISNDAWIDAWNVGANHGADAVLKVRTGGVYKALIRADMPPQVMGRLIVSATLRLYVEARSNTAAGTLSAYRLKRAWDEASVTFNTPWVGPGAADPTDAEGLADGNAPMGTVGMWFTLDVTSAVRAWSGGTANDGLLLVYASDSSTVYELSSRSRVGKEPAIEITIR
jgi:hypothetical protein